MKYYIKHDGAQYQVRTRGGKVSEVRASQDYCAYGPAITEGAAYDAALEDYAELCTSSDPLTFIGG